MRLVSIQQVIKIMAFNQIEIIQIETGIVCKLIDSDRYYFNNMNIKFINNGFINANAKEIIKAKLIAHDFAYAVNADNLTLNFEVTNGNKQMFYSLVMNEVYPELEPEFNVPVNIENKIEHILKIFTNKINSMNDKINELTNKVRQLENDLEESKYN